MRNKNQNVYTVGQVNSYIKNIFDQDYMLRRIYVSGEVSNCKYHPSGHIYFSLKDAEGTISCVMFAGSRRGLAFPMRDGDNVIVGGSISVYERDGKYQIYAKEITKEGAGLLYEKYLALKAELEEMGMFAPEYKQPIPAYVKKIGVVTAPTGAAVQDIKKHCTPPESLCPDHPLPGHGAGRGSGGQHRGGHTPSGRTESGCADRGPRRRFDRGSLGVQ